MRNVFVFVVLQAILICSCSPRSAPVTAQPSIALTDCVLSSPGVETQVDAKCGSLAVSEDPANPQSRPIMLGVAAVQAIKRSPEPDPLFILAGGPGQSGIEVFPAIASALFRIHEKRDIVLVDQRGTGKSNPLRCLDPEQDEVLEDEQVIALLQDCTNKL